MKLLLLLLPALTALEIPSPACHNPMPRTPPIGKSPFVTNTWNFLELLSNTQQFLQMTTTLRESTRILYSVLVKTDQTGGVYIPYFPFTQALELYTHIVERKLHCWPFPKYLAFYLVQLRDLNVRGRIESYEPREPRVPNPVREVPVRQTEIVRERATVREIPGTVKGTPRTSDRDTFKTSETATKGRIDILAGEGAVPGNQNNEKIKEGNTLTGHAGKLAGQQYMLFGNEQGVEGDTNTNEGLTRKGLSAFMNSQKATPQKPMGRGGIWSNMNLPPPGEEASGLAPGSGLNQGFNGGIFDFEGRRSGSFPFRPGADGAEQGLTDELSRNILPSFGDWTRFPNNQIQRPPPNNPGNPIVIGDSIEEEEKEDTPPGGMEIETQPGTNQPRRLFKRAGGEDDTAPNTRDKKLPTLYANPLRALQANIEDFWSPIFDFLVSDSYLGFNHEQNRPTWQVALPWREYGDTLKKVSTILQVWQKDREVKQKVLTVEQLEGKFGHLLQAMTLGRVITPYPRRPEDEVHIEEDDEELTVEEPSYG
ncbi:hypothetical protein TWF481_003858 [Arthrobotrys musiformis]|uniref:Uncharacterized protein n=1 Tax=Arthrobotrys musiformis TaxID=47236 RepID=A0AAV9WJR3_9PEZI